jgi:hypothetical protein
VSGQRGAADTRLEPLLPDLLSSPPRALNMEFTRNPPAIGDPA